MFTNDGVECDTVGRSIVNVAIGNRSDYVGVVESYEANRREPHNAIDLGRHQLRRSGGRKRLACPNLNEVIIAERSFFSAPQALNDYTTERSFARSSIGIKNLKLSTRSRLGRLGAMLTACARSSNATARLRN